MRRLIVVCLLMLLPACGKHVALCLDMEADAHVNGTVTAGPWGDVLELNVHGPGSIERIPEGMAFNPCRQAQP